MIDGVPCKARLSLKRLQLRLCKRRFICPFFRRAFLSVTCSYFSTFKPSLAEEHFLEQSNTLSHTFSCNFHEAYRFLWDIFSLSNRRLRGRKRSSKYGARKGSLCTRLEHVLASIPDDTEFIPERRMNFCLHILFSLAKILEIQFPETKMSNRESGRCQEFEISNRKARQIGPSRAEAKIDRPGKSFSTAFNHSVFRST